MSLKLAHKFARDLQRGIGPTSRLVDGMPYVHSTATDITKTWARHGFTPTTEADRAKRNAKHRVQA
jgi:hypothetical protein